MIKKRFKDKIVLVTGAAQGMGKEIALKFIAEGAKVALLDNNYNNLKKYLISKKKGVTYFY